MGAQGNSGMILSQLVRGAAEALAGGGAVDGAAVAGALRDASRAADAAVRHPVEGTMLSVARAMAAAAEAALPGDRDAVLGAAVAAGADAVAATTGQLDVLREAGVVDSGALGVLILVEGLAGALSGRPPRAAPAHAPSRPATAAHPPSRYRFCTTFLVEGPSVDLGALEDALTPIGDSILVMGDARRAKVHVHTDAPERAAGLAAAWGVVEGMKADDMRRQEAERAARLAAAIAPGGLVAVVEGEGVRDLLAGLGVAAVPPGDRFDDAAVVLALAPAPDAPDAEVVEVPALPAMLAAALAWDPGDDAAANVARMREAAAEVTSVDVSPATREALAAAVAPALAAGAGLVTVLVGAGAGVAPAEVEAWARALVPPGVEVEAHHGGQAAPALAVGIE
jgi:dihydroxyacetone kinase-like predicted kinase